MSTSPHKPSVRTDPAYAHDGDDCNTGMSAAHAIAKSVIYQCLQERLPGAQPDVIEEIARELAYDIALSGRHQHPLTVIASQAVAAAFAIGQEELDQVSLFLSRMPSAVG